MHQHNCHQRKYEMNINSSSTIHFVDHPNAHETTNKNITKRKHPINPQLLDGVLIFYFSRCKRAKTQQLEYSGEDISCGGYGSSGDSTLHHVLVRVVFACHGQRRPCDCTCQSAVFLQHKQDRYPLKSCNRGNEKLLRFDADAGM